MSLQIKKVAWFSAIFFFGFIVGLFTINILNLNIISKDNDAGYSKKGVDKCNVVIENNEALFLFPIEVSNYYSWYQNTTADNAQEYTWDIHLGEDNDSVKFGVYLFKFPGKSPREGSLKKLIRNAQYSVWVQSNESNMFEVRDDLMISTKLKDGRVIIAVKDRHTYDTLFKNKPSKALFRVLQPNMALYCEAAVNY